MAINVAGYAKLAKQWEKNRTEALNLQNDYFQNLFGNNQSYNLVGIYVDITGNKEIRKRTEMIKLLNDCVSGNVDLIYTQTRGYLAANTRELCYLIKFIFDLDHRIDIVTEDGSYNINTIEDEDNQRKELYNMADKYSKLNQEDYTSWKTTILDLIKGRK